MRDYKKKIEENIKFYKQAVITMFTSNNDLPLCINQYVGKCLKTGSIFTVAIPILAISKIILNINGYGRFISWYYLFWAGLCAAISAIAAYRHILMYKKNEGQIVVATVKSCKKIHITSVTNAKDKKRGLKVIVKDSNNKTLTLRANINDVIDTGATYEFFITLPTDDNKQYILNKYMLEEPNDDEID